MNPFKIGAGLFAAFFAISILFGSWYTVDQAERGVLVRNGAYVSTEQPGLHFKMPLIEDVTKINVANRLLRWGDKDAKLEGYSHDQQASHYVISVNYNIKPDKVAEVYSSWGGADGVISRIITPNVLKHSKSVIGQFTAQTSIQDRGRLNNELLKALQAATDGTPIVISNVNVEDIKFSAEYEASISKRMTAEVEVQTQTQNLARENVLAKIVVAKANGAADSIRATATAEADAIKLKGNAEASAIEAKAKALGQNPNLVTLIQAERWNGSLPTTMVPGGALPMVNLGK